MPNQRFAPKLSETSLPPRSAVIEIGPVPGLDSVSRLDARPDCPLAPPPPPPWPAWPPAPPTVIFDVAFIFPSPPPPAPPLLPFAACPGVVCPPPPPPPWPATSFPA